jgi:hypothetical protein
LALCGFVGCNGASSEYKPAKDIPVAAHDEHHHDHEAEGPHHGTIVELGEEEFHAEIVREPKFLALRVHLLGPDAKTAATTTAADLTITLDDGRTLVLKPVESPPEGPHSTFEVIDPKGVDEVKELEFIHGTLVVTIGGKPYSAELDVHFDGDMHDDAKPAEPAAPAP